MNPVCGTTFCLLFSKNFVPTMHNPVPITPSLTASFRDKGFMKLERCLSETMLEHLRESVDRICAKTEQYPDLVHNETPDGTQYICGIDFLLLKDEPVFLELLGSPLLLSIAEAICGSDFFPVQEFVVIKKLGDPSVIDWHQDVVSHSVGTTCMVGLYLDAANEENGALKIVPGSQHMGTDICDLKKLPAVGISTQPGDILVHDLMVAHCSGPLTEFPQRRVVYFEFMNKPRALEDQVYSEEFITARTQLIDLAKEFYQSASAEIPENTRLEIAAIHENLRDIKPANYCFEFH